MAWIRVVDEDEADGKLKKIYERIKRERGKLSNIMKVHSLHPSAMKTHMNLYLAIMFSHFGLKREEKELIAVVVSAANKCEYCMHHHAEALNHYWKDDEKIQRLVQDFRLLDLSEKKQEILEYAVKLTKMPDKVEEGIVQNLRESGFSDEDILTINLVTSYFNFVNRIALGLGVEFTPEEIEGYKYQK